MIRFVTLILTLLLFTGLAYSVLSMSHPAQGLARTVHLQIQNSGVSNPVTAVLMNFRAYDTLLEMSVLFISLLGVYSLSHSKREAKSLLHSPVLKRLGGILVPILLLLAAYLLWVGAHAPGGAFQAGSVISATGILIFLSEWKFDLSVKHFFVRLLIAISLLVFFLISAGTLLLSHTLLEFSPTQASVFIFLLEAAATVSIGVTLFNLFVTVFSHSKEES
ncbi:hypothetical protein LCX93_02870 [Sulfurimonas sp. SWIR-19]|uniref:hydrogen gas-evolving membrane-bound hydrogenase subunit E n=1 Tax=Sulfurimonas sp. SWIR-19 TaxID=2878390 RepID=UPI001CF5ECD7|nr:hydrogen gas-evolving membrane-bound hydrogenase subunit E [Sulfurimonas sp. SWIR-19]UCN00874.1 hypothetical protein LCX93_02870 [Sulfurimonas sp. SWIR-19]